MREATVKSNIDISDINIKALIAFALFLIVFLLLYVAFLK